jgi:hypothetical protein
MLRKPVIGINITGENIRLVTARASGIQTATINNRCRPDRWQVRNSLSINLRRGTVRRPECDKMDVPRKLIPYKTH